ncbi:MAG: hypothetical protein J7J76_06460 [Candidatus Latescibacteria bacterium]|nr:hypothetical protein [Candidatus Latescibacterota bacterium]
MVIPHIGRTAIFPPHLAGYRDATSRHPEKGYTVCFVHIITDTGQEGLAAGRGGIITRELFEAHFAHFLGLILDFLSAVFSKLLLFT